MPRFAATMVLLVVAVRCTAAVKPTHAHPTLVRRRAAGHPQLKEETSAPSSAAFLRKETAAPLSGPAQSPAQALETWQAVGVLNVATLIWGSQHAIIKEVVADASPSSTNAARFLIAAVASLPFLPGTPWRQSTAATASATWKDGLELGGWSFLGFALQAIGLQYTTASRSAFLLYLNVKFVPLLALLLYGRRSSGRTWLSAALAFVGTALLSYDGSPPNLGDAWSLAAALASACFILRLEEAASTRAPAEELNAATIVTSALLTSLWCAGELLLLPDGGGLERAHELSAALWAQAAPLTYLALVTTFAAQWLQALGQSRVRAQDAAVIYALDPVYAAGFSYLLLGESLGTQGLAGAAVVLAAVLVSRGAVAGGGDEAEGPLDGADDGAGKQA